MLFGPLWHDAPSSRLLHQHLATPSSMSALSNCIHCSRSSSSILASEKFSSPSFPSMHCTHLITPSSGTPVFTRLYSGIYHRALEFLLSTLLFLYLVQTEVPRTLHLTSCSLDGFGHNIGPHQLHLLFKGAKKATLQIVMRGQQDEAHSTVWLSNQWHYLLILPISPISMQVRIVFGLGLGMLLEGRVPSVLLAWSNGFWGGGYGPTVTIILEERQVWDCLGRVWSCWYGWVWCLQNERVAVWPVLP